jgi:hypothetical protein
MTGLGRMLCRIVATAAVLIASGTAGQAAGAFALGNCGAYGFSYDYRQPAAASQAALGKCSGDCKVIPIRRACAAFAIDGANACGASGYATGSKLGAAQNTALRQCYKYGGRDCVIRAWICDAKG